MKQIETGGEQSARRRVQLVAIAAGLLVFTIVQVALAGGSPPKATSSAKLKSEVAKLKARVAALESKPDQVGPTPTIPPTPTTLPPSGTAGGELAGTYPNPTIGTAAGLDLASSTGTDAGINFGTDVDLYRSAANVLTLSPPDTLAVSSAVVSNGLTVNPGLVFMGENSGVILGSANTAVLYAKDSGANKTQLWVKWPGGADTMIATEP